MLNKYLLICQARTWIWLLDQITQMTFQEDFADADRETKGWPFQRWIPGAIVQGQQAGLEFLIFLSHSALRFFSSNCPAEDSGSSTRRSLNPPTGGSETRCRHNPPDYDPYFLTSCLGSVPLDPLCRNNGGQSCEVNPVCSSQPPRYLPPACPGVFPSSPLSIPSRRNQGWPVWTIAFCKSDSVGLLRLSHQR